MQPFHTSTSTRFFLSLPPFRLCCPLLVRLLFRPSLYTQLTHILLLYTFSRLVLCLRTPTALLHPFAAWWSFRPLLPTKTIDGACWTGIRVRYGTAARCNGEASATKKKNHKIADAKNARSVHGTTAADWPSSQQHRRHQHSTRCFHRFFSYSNQHCIEDEHRKFVGLPAWPPRNFFHNFQSHNSCYLRGHVLTRHASVAPHPLIESSAGSSSNSSDSSSILTISVIFMETASVGL